MRADVGVLLAGVAAGVVALVTPAGAAPTPGPEPGGAWECRALPRPTMRVRLVLEAGVATRVGSTEQNGVSAVWLGTATCACRRRHGLGRTRG